MKASATPEQKKKAAAYMRGWNRANPTKARYNSTKWRREHPDKARAYDRRKIGLPEPTRPCPCPDLCESCGRPPSAKKSMNLDHDHETGAFRGWLCGRCNSAAGFLADDPQLCLKLAKYLGGKK